MTSLLTRLTTIRMPGGPQESQARIQAREGAADGAPATAAESRASIFINPQALTFPVAVGLVKGAWEALKLAPLPGVTTVWFPLVICLAIGVIITVNNLGSTNLRGSMKLLGILIGVLNSLVMFAAVLGVSK